MGVGACYILEILRTKQIDAFVSLNPLWLLDEEKEVYDKIKEFVARYHQFPPITEVFKHPPKEYKKGYPITYWENKLKERYAAQLLSKIKLLSTNSTEPLKDLEAIHKQVAAFYENYEMEAVIAPDKIGGFIKRTLDTLRKNRLAGSAGYDTGYPTLNEVTGGYIPGEIFVYVARLKMGKTMYLLNSLATTLKHHKCMFISMEMSLETIIKRLLAIRLKTPQFLDPQRVVPSFLDAEINKLNPNLVLINGASINSISHIGTLINLHKPQIVYIDGAYLLEDGTYYRSEWERAKKVIERLKKVALSKKVALVCSYQLNRQATKKDAPEVEHIALTDAVAQTAGAVCAIIPNKNDDTKRRFLLLANREGPSGIDIEVHWDFVNMGFIETGEVSVISAEEVNDETGW